MHDPCELVRSVAEHGGKLDQLRDPETRLGQANEYNRPYTALTVSNRSMKLNSILGSRLAEVADVQAGFEPPEPTEVHLVARKLNWGDDSDDANFVKSMYNACRTTHGGVGKSPFQRLAPLCAKTWLKNEKDFDSNIKDPGGILTLHINNDMRDAPPGEFMTNSADAAFASVAAARGSTVSFTVDARSSAQGMLARLGNTWVSKVMDDCFISVTGGLQAQTNVAGTWCSTHRPARVVSGADIIETNERVNVNAWNDEHQVYVTESYTS